MSQAFDVAVVGAGAAGLLAAARAAERGRGTVLLEKNTKAGVKILMSGGTRCNLTHDTDARGIIPAFGRNGRFLHSALSSLGPADVVQLFEREGVQTKVESTGKVFPVSNKALDVQKALLARLARSGGELRLRSSVTGVVKHEAGFQVQVPEGLISAKRLIVASGGCSYPGCGTTGEGYGWLASLGHTIVPPRPALVPLTTDLEWVRELTGLTLPDVVVRVVPRAVLEAAGDDPVGRCAVARKKKTDERRGSVLFTHFGLSGPAILDVSRSITSQSDPRSVEIACDLLPVRSLEEVENQFQRLCEQHGARSIARILSDLVPQRLALAIVQQLSIYPEQRGAELSKQLRRRLAATSKSLSIPISGTRGFAKAEVTAGGVSLSEVDSRTMESKLVPGLFIVGEVLDLDGWIGGYNFQSAFSTGWLAAENV